jgi:H+/Cl- antiporter ClcA
MDAKIKYKRFFIILGQWLFFGVMIGVIVGSLTAFLMELNDFLGTIREENGWLIFFLPLGGIVSG